MKKRELKKLVVTTAAAVVMLVAIWALFADAATVTDFYNQADPFPNTTSTDITVDYSASVAQDTQIELTFATSGEFVRRLYSGTPALGTSFTYTWDARNDSNVVMGPGTYIATVKTGVQFTYNTKIEGTGMIMSNPTDIFVDDTGNIYFINVGNEMVEKINTSGTLLVKFDAGDDGASLTYGVAADSSGNIYVSDSANDRIMKYDPNGQLLNANYICNGCTISQTLNDPRGIYVYSDNLFVVEYGDDDVNRFNLITNTTVWQGMAVDDHPNDVAVGNLNGGGTPYVFVTVGPDNEINSFIYSSGASCAAAQDMQDDATLNGCTTPMGIDVNSRSNATHIYVTCTGNDKVLKYPLTDTAGLTASYSFGTYGGGTDQLNDPSGVTLLVNTNYIFVADSNNNRLSVLFDNGASLVYDSLIEADEYNLFEPTDMAVDPAKYIYIASYQGNFVKKFTQSGLYVDTFGNTGTAAGQFDGVEGVEVYDSTGDGIADYIYAADKGNSRVQCYDVANGAWNNNAPSTCGAGWGASGFSVPSPLGLGFDDVNGIIIVAKGVNPKLQIGINLDGTQAWTDSVAAIIDDNAADFNSNTFYTTSSSKQVRDGADGNPKGKCYDGASWGDSPPYGITLDDFGNVYITTDNGDGTCVYMTKMGRYYSTLLTGSTINYVAGTGSYGSGDGQFLAPRGVTVDPDGEFVWVADRSNDRAQKFIISYTSTKQDNVTICENIAPTVNNVLLSDPSPTQAGTVQFSIAFSACGMQALYEPTAWFTTGDISPVSVQIFDEALILDTGAVPGEYDLTDTVILGRSPAVGTTLTSISVNLKFVNTDASTSGGFPSYTAGANPETICRDGDSDNVCDIGEPRWGVTTDIGNALSAFTGSYAYPDYNGNAQFDGYFVNNEYRGYGEVPTGHDGIATIKVCGPTPTYTGPRSDGGLYMAACNTSNTFLIDTTGPSVNINVDNLVTIETWTPAYGNTETNTDVTVAMTDFTCFGYDADGDSVVDAGENILGCTVGTHPCCSLSENLIPLLSREKHVEKTGGTSNRYDATEAVAYDSSTGGNSGYYDPGVDTLILCNGITTCAEPDSSGNCTAPCTAPVSGEPLVAFTSLEKVIRVSSQDVSTDAATESYYANHITMPAPVPGYKYFTAIATDESGNTGNWYEPRLRVRRIEFPPGRAEWRPTSYDADETMNSKNSYTIRYTAASEFDNGVCGLPGACTEDCYVAIDVPTGWDAPSSVSGSPGEVYVATSAGTTLCATTYSLSSNKIKVLVSEMAAGSYVDVTYGYMGNGGPGAKIGTSATVGQTPFVVKSCIACAGSEAEMDNPSITVHPMPLKVSRTKKLGAGAKTVIYDNEVKADIMTLAFRNINVAPNTAKVTSMKIKVLPTGTAGPYYPSSVISKVYLYDGAGNLIVEDNSIETSGSTITLEDLPGNPINISPGGTNGVEVKVDFKCLSTACTPNLQLTSLEFLIDGDADLVTGTTTAAMTEITMADSTKSWGTNNYSGYTLIPDITKPTNTYVIAYNTGTLLTVRSTDLMVTDRGSSASGSNYAIGYEGTSMNAYVGGTSMHVTSDKAQSATFYPDDPTANAEMTSGKVSSFLPPPIARMIYVRYDNTTWPNLANQKLSKGQTSTQPFKLKMRLMDSYLSASCASGGTVLMVADGSMFTMGDTVIIGDLNSLSSDSTSYMETTVASVFGNIVNISPPGCTKDFNTTNTAYMVRKNALASITGLDIKVEGDGIGVDPAPNGIISRKVLVGYADTTSIESTGSTISFDQFLDETTGTPIALDALTFPKQLDFKVNILCSGVAASPQACPSGTSETKVKFSIPATSYITVGDPADTSIYPSPWVTAESFTGTIQDQAWITALSVDRASPDECPSEAGIGTSFDVDVRISNPAAVGSFERSKGRMYSSSSDLKFTCTSGSCTPGGDYTSQFTVTPTSPTTASFVSVNPGESATMTYSIVHSAASPTPGVYAIDINYTGAVSTNKPQGRDGNDYYDNDKLYVNRETDGATTKPCGVESKAAPAYLTANSVTPGTYQAADTDIVIMKFTITDGPDLPAGWWVQQVDVQSGDTDDSDVAMVRLWADDGDGTFDAGDLEIENGTFNASGVVSFKASNNPGVWNNTLVDPGADTWATTTQAFYVTYDLGTAVTDGDIIDAYIPMNGVTLYNAASGTYIFPGATANSPGQSTIDVIATKVSMKPSLTTACINSEKIINVFALDAYDNLDTGSTEYVDITMTHTSGANATLINTTSMTAPTFYAGAGGYNRVTGNLVGGIGDVTFLEDHIDTVTLTPTSSLGSEVSNTAVGDNVCLSAKNITTGVYPAGQNDVILMKFTVTNGKPDPITLDSLRIHNTGTCDATALDGAHLYNVDTSTHVGDFAAFGSGAQAEYATYTFAAYSIAPVTSVDFWVKYNIAQTGVTDSTTLDTQIPIAGLKYTLSGLPYYLDEQAADSPSYSLIDIDANTLRLEPNVSKTLLAADCNSCTTAFVADASLLSGETQLAIGGNSDRTVMTVQSLNIGANSVTFTSPATGTFTSGVHYVYNLITNSKKLRLQVEDVYGNICLDDEGDSEPFSVEIETPATIQETTFNVWSCSSSSWATGTQYAGGCTNNGFATNTFEYTGCAPQSFVVTPNSTLAKYTGREFTATIDFPGDILSDGIGPVVDDVGFDPSITGCISTYFPEISVVSGTDDCSGVQAFRLACAGDNTAFNSVDNWISIGAATETADVCCNCAGDPRDVGCGFNITNGSICKSAFDISDGSCGDIEGWVVNDAEPDAVQDSGCVANGTNRVYVQFKDRAGNETGLPIATSTIPVVIDTLPPTISSPVSIYSVDKETYFYGTGDAAYPEAPLTACDANPQGTDIGTLSEDCLVWFNSAAGEGGGQTARFEVIAEDTNALFSLEGSSAFGQTPTHSIAPASGPYTFSVDYVIPDGGSDEVVYLSVSDTCDNSQIIQVNMKQDNEDPSLPAIYGFATDSSGVSLASSTWYSYPSIYFNWSGTSDNPAGTVLTDNAGLVNYKYVATTDPTMDYANLVYATGGTEFTATGPLVSGNYYYAFMSPHDRVGNFASPTFASFTYYYDATSPLNPGVPVSGFASSTDFTVLSSGASYGYSNPYFTWSTPADQPLAPLNSSGVAGYYVVFSTDSSATPVSYQTAATYTASPSTCYESWYLRLYTVDSSTPPNFASAVTAFNYTMRGQVLITDNQDGDYTWRNASGTTYNVDFSISCGALDHVDYTIWSRQDMGAGTGSEVVPWSTLIATATVGAVQAYTTDFEVPFDSATDGWNFVTIKAFDQIGNITVATDVFFIKKDTVPPDNAPSVNAYSDYTAGTGIASGTWYNYSAPYFTWAAVSDLPDDNNAPTPLNSGFDSYNIYFGTSSTGTPYYATTTPAFMATQTLVSGVYYLRMSNSDVVGNATSVTTLFSYYYDNTPPPIPAVVGVCDKDKSPPIANICTSLEVDWTWWAHISQPYIEWSTSTDPHSGLKLYHYYWGMNAVGDPLTDPDALTSVINGVDQEEEIQMNKPTPVGAYIGHRFYLRMVTEDNVGNFSAPTEIFNYVYDPSPPTAPAASGYDDIGIAYDITAGSGTIYYSYPNPYFEWSNAAAGEVGESGLAAYFATLTTDFSFTPATDTSYLVATTTTSICNPGITVASEFCYDSAASGPALVSGNYYYLNITALDKAINRAGNTAGGNVSNPVVAFEYWYDASAPDNPTTPITGWDSVGHSTPISTGNIYSFTDPQFIWGSAVDNPTGPLNSAGVAGYYVAFATNQYASPTIASYQATTTYTANPSTCYENWYLRVRTQDAAVPPNVAATATTLFTYKRKGAVSLTNNVIGDYTWRNATGTTYDVEFDASCGYIDHVDYTIWSRSNMGNGTGSEVVPWSTLLDAVTIGGVDHYAVPFEVPFGNATDGWNFVTLKVFDPYGNFSVATDTFFIKKDTVPPDNATSVVAFSDYTAGTGINSGTWYGYPAPYFTWAAGVDQPDDNNAPTPLNSGFADYYIYFGTGAASAPTYSTATNGFLSTDTLVSGNYYYLRQSSEDNVGNATTATTLFSYYYDVTAPLNPGVPVNAFASASMITGFTHDRNYPYDSVYFTWSTPQDQPLAPLNSSGVSGYYVGFGTDTASTPVYFTSSNDYFASTSLCNATHVLRIRTVDSSTPPNVSTAATVFEYYWQGIPFVTDNQGADLTWHNAGPIGPYDIDFGAQCGNIKSVEYTFYSGSGGSGGTGTQSLNWTYLSSPTDLSPTYGLPMYTTNWNIPVADFNSASEGVNWVSFRVRTVADYYAYATDTFTFRKDTTPPTIVTAGVLDTSNYFWVSPANGQLYFGLSMAGEEFFAFAGTATDTLSGLATATFSTAYGDTPVDDTTPESWSGSYGITSANNTAATITVTVYDVAGNSVATETHAIQNATLTITFATMTAPLLPMFPTFVQFDVYYPDGVTPMISNDENLGYGLYATVTPAIDTSFFLRAYDADGNPVSVHDDIADVGADEFVVSLLEYQTGAFDTCGGAVSGTNHWCAEYYTGDCLSSTNPHYMEFYNTSFMTDGFYAGMSEKTTDGDLGAAAPAPVSNGDAGTFQAHTGPSYIKAYPAGDGLVTADGTISNWCFGVGCIESCNVGATDLWCSNDAATITAKPDYFKFENATQDRAFDNVADDTIPVVSQWSWDTSFNRVMIADVNNPSVAATTTYTPNNGSELVCVELKDSCDQTITSGRWQDETVRLTFSDAPDSHKDIAENNVAAYRGFYNVTTPGNYYPPDQLIIQGDLLNGLACITVTAETTPSDNPQTPIRIDPTYLGSPALTHTGGTDTAAFVLIRPNGGLASGTAQFAGFTSVYDLYVPSATAPIDSIVMEPDFSFDGSKLAYVSRQNDPCGTGNLSLTDTYHTNFNLYTLTMSGGILSDCRILTSNDSLGYGPDPNSGVTFDNSDLDLDGSYGDRIVFAAYNPLTLTRKLMWVSATGTVSLATGTQYLYSPFDNSPNQTTIPVDINIGVSIFTVDPPALDFATGEQIILANADQFTFEYLTFEVRTITGYDPNTYEVYIDSPTTILFEAFGATTMGVVQSPVTLADMGQTMVDITDGADWFDPDWSPDDSVCSNAGYRDTLIAIRQTQAGSEDTECSPACAEYGGGGTTDPNIVQIYGAKDANGMFKVDGSTSDVRKLTHFTDSDIWPLKPKWSPNCDMISFVAWDRSNIGPPSETSVYIMNLNSSSPGFATVTLPVTSLTDAGVYPVYSFASSSYSAHTPNWSADGKMVSYAIDKNGTFDLVQMNSGPDDLVTNLFTSSDFDSYLEYILDQPASQDAIISPQVVGRVSNNEFGLLQCPGNINDVATACPNSPNFPFVHVGQFYGSQDAFLRQMTLSDRASINDGGGIMFLDGIVTAVFPPNVLASDTVFWNQDPTIGYCGGAVGAGNCPLDPTNEFIVQAGDARDYFPDGTNFNTYIRLIFHYCDNDNDGKVDANTEGIMTATTGGTVPFAYNSLTGECTINGASTSGGTIDVDTLSVYNWDTANAQWVRLTGILDKTNKTLSVFSDHFSLYETLGFRTYAPQVLTPLSLTGVRTYPNPFVEPNHPDGIRFAATGITGTADVNIDIKIYDIRGSFVAQLVNIVPSNFNTVMENNSYTLYHWKTPSNASGRRLASGIYIYYLYARDTNGYEVTLKGKFSVVR